MKYRAEIDGLRALAVVPVILFHAGFELFSGGFVGVDVFFVISGYLITTILIEDIENKRFSIVTFYERRARRILPALFFVVISTYIIGWQFLNPFDLKEVAQSLFATSIFLSNFYFFLKTGYFDTSAELKPLLHTWSLAVEEQYYVLFPIFLILAWRFGKNRVFWMIVVMAASSLLLSEWQSRTQPTANFYLTHARAWELLSGSLAAFIVSRNGVQKNSFLATIGLTAIMASIFAYDSGTPFPSLYTLMPVIGVVLVILNAHQDTLVSKFLSNRLLVGIGLISYSLYLWHQPIFALTRQFLVDDFSHRLAIALIFVILILSYFTWKFIEQPARKFKKSGYEGKHILYISTLMIVVMAGIGTVGHIERGHPERNPNLLRLAQNGGLSFACSGAELDDSRCMSASNPSVALWGDSHAMHLAKALEIAFPEVGLHQLTLSDCPPVPGYMSAPIKAAITCNEFNARVHSYLTENTNSPIKTVIVASSRSVSNEETIDAFQASIRQLQENGTRVILVSSTPRFQNVEQCITLSMRGVRNLNDCSYNLTEAENVDDFSDLEALANSLDIEFINLSEFICSHGICHMNIEGKLVLRDAGHLTNEIQTELARYFREKLQY